MNIKTLILALAGLFLLNTSFAQDKLYKKNGDVLSVNVEEITPRVVTYKKADNPNGPSYTIGRNEVSKVIYANGSEDYFGPQDDRKPRKKADYGNNIIAIAPLQITNNIGIGLSYERVLDKENILSFYLPFAMSFGNSNFDPVTGQRISNGSTNPRYYLMPGLKFYPTGGKGVVRYAVGPNIAFATGKESGTWFLLDDNGNVIGVDSSDRTRTMLGIMVTNSLNINPTEKIYLGLELGLGFTYLNKIGGLNDNTEALAQFAFRIGYRF